MVRVVLVTEEWMFWNVWAVQLNIGMCSFFFTVGYFILQFKWHVLMVRVVRVSEQWTFRNVWTVYTKGMFRRRSSWQAWTSVHPTRVFTVGDFIFICKQWGPKHVCTFITRLGMCSRAEIFLIAVDGQNMKVAFILYLRKEDENKPAHLFCPVRILKLLIVCTSIISIWQNAPKEVLMLDYHREWRFTFWFGS